MRTRIRVAVLLLVVALAVACGRAGSASAADLTSGQHAALVAKKEKKLVSYARTLLGVRYSYGGVSPRTGFDCSGFTRYVYAHFGVTLPHYSGAQFSLGRRISRWALKPGDLVFFSGLGHVGLYIGHGRFIHAPHTGTDVSIDSLNGWYGSEYDGARRIL